MKTQFTPGPWKVDSVLAQVVIPGKDIPICKLLWPTMHRTDGETKANARLIAKAPDMYELLDEIREKLYECAEGNIVRDWLGKADMLLAEIRGES
jgi:hypothetical protein